MWVALQRAWIFCAVIHWAALTAMLATLALPTDAEAARRAFVIGNASYAHAVPLPNPANDARDVAGRLTDLGWQVTLQLDVTRSALLRSFAAFTIELQPDDLSLVYFAGHAVQIGGENYLAPVDARIESEEGVRTQFVPLNSLLADLSRLSRSRIVILDACRDNPLAEGLARAGQGQTRSVGAAKGLARVYAGVGSFIVFSTQPGNVALDGTGRNSPFTKSLLQHMLLQGADVHAVLRRVRADVQHDTQEQQVPWENSSLIDEVGFATEAAPPVRQAEVPPAARPPATASNPRNVQAPLPSPATPQPPAATKAPPPRPAQTERFHYVTGLDPKGDNFLALRSGPKPEDVRIATMGPDTLVRVRESQGPWRRVELTDGMTGWAHSNWIACCRMAAVRPAEVAVPVPPPKASKSGGSDKCDNLWLRRNEIWHKHGYCFTTARGRQAFDTSACFRDQGAARAAMSASERSTVDALLAEERSLSCR